MAIIRQRLPVPGPFDIRIGLPRDKGFDPVEAKKRLSNNRPNRNTTINKFRSMVSGAEGLYRPAKFLVVLEFPKTFTTDTLQGFEFNEYQQDFSFLKQTELGLRERLFFFCSGAQLPERTITDTAASHYYGPERNIARGVEFGTMDLTFMLDSELSERVIFEAWQNLVINTRTCNANYYDEYIGKILVFPLHENRNETSNAKIEGVPNYGSLATLTLSGYYVELIEAWPKTLGAVNLSYGNTNQVANQTVTFNYRYWKSNANLRSQENTNPDGDIDGVGEIKDPRYLRGPLGSIISKLPPEIRRAGRDVINQVKTRFPTGRIFGGKVFPPFF
jgi:hypothetical protein